MNKKNEIEKFFEEKPGYLKKSPVFTLNKLFKSWKIEDYELTKKIQRDTKLRLKGVPESKIKGIDTPKRLFFDIETTPNVVYSWNVGHKVNISYDSIIQERRIICIGYKWENEKTQCLVGEDDTFDYNILKKFFEIISQADEVIGHNSDQYDIKFIRTRCIAYDLSFPEKLFSSDTMQNAKKMFRFNSNRMDYIGDYLLEGNKTETDFQMWKDIVEKNSNYKKSLNRMVEYCKDDVELLERIYHRMQKYMPERKYRYFKVK